MSNGNISRFRDVVETIRSHAGVRDAFACQPSQPGDSKVVAFVLANEGYFDHALARSTDEKTRLRIWKKTYDLSQFDKAADTAPLAFNTLGWNSVYTRRPIPEEDMREWVQTTVERILSLNPQNILEIGCGTGLLMLRLAPACKRYVGVDFSAAVLKRLREQLGQMPEISRKVELVESSADEIAGLPDDSFDTLIINSAAQYFPNLQYLNRVLQKATHLVKPGGHIFVGDSRSLPLLRAFALSVEAVGAASDTRTEEVRERVNRRIHEDRELVLSPAFFLSYPQRYPKVANVAIHPRRGTLDNEMTRFRYDAIIRIGMRPEPGLEIPFSNPPQNGWILGEVRSLLTTARSDALGFATIRNARVEKHVQLLNLLQDAEPSRSLAELRRDAGQSATHGIHPESLIQIAEQTGYQVALSWASCRSDGSYDAVFLRRSSTKSGLFPAIAWPRPASLDTVHYASQPGLSKYHQQFVEDLTTYCASRLPERLVPRRVHVLDAFPTANDGTIDYGALFVLANGL